MNTQIIVLAISLWAAHSAIIPYPRMKSVAPTGPCGNPLFLTPYIDSGKISEGQVAAKVTPLKGNIDSYAGLLTVDSRYNSTMFFWFFPADNNPEEAPVALWLQGGPGAASVWAVFNENGPYTITDQQTLEINEYYWSQELNVIYIDNPVGTGFSFTDDDAGYSRNETAVGENLYKALIQFFQLFPQYQKNKFFVTGESYAGKYIPAVAYTIHEKNPSADLKINLEGIAIGDGLCDPEHMFHYGDYLYQIGMIDSKGRDEFRAIEKKAVKYIKKGKYDEAFHEFDILLNGDLTPYKTLYYNLTGFSNYFNYLQPVEIDSGDTDSFLGKNKVRQALHVGNLKFHDDDKVEKFLLDDIMQSIKPWLEVLMNHYRVLLYNGQVDVIVAYPLTVSFVNKLKWNGKKEYEKAARNIWYVGKDIAGYYKTSGNFTEVLVRDAGHMVPHDQPLWALELITKFTQGIPL